MKKDKYLVALPTFKGGKGFCHPTILVSASSEEEAKETALRLSKERFVGDAKIVDYVLF